MKLLAIFLLPLLIMVSAIEPAWAADNIDTFDTAFDLKEILIENTNAQQTTMNHMWTMIAAALIALMQCGFLMLEAGMVRSKSTVSVAQKNITDFIFSVASFYLIGFMFMFGASYGGFIGIDAHFFLWDFVGDWSYTFFIFQAMFVGTAATIMSGAVAERMKFSAYIIMAVILSAFIYPAFGHWAWGNLLINNNAWLADMGFIDFAGSTVVHSIGGWVALAAIVVLGPRAGKFDKDGTPNIITGDNYALSVLGVLLLFIGWFGFNGGSTTVADPAFAHIISNTVISAVFAGCAGCIFGRIYDGHFHPVRTINGMLGGLVGITAGCDVVGTHGALIIGLTSGLIVFYASWILEHKFKLDDVVGAVAVHGFGGAWGTLMVGIFVSEASLGHGSSIGQILVQMTGIGAAFLWSFGVSYIFLKLLDKFIGIRVSEQEELSGLNLSSHNS